MPVHRILIHGADITEAAIGYLSEKPQECRNKDLKRFPECSRYVDNNKNDEKYSLITQVLLFVYRMATNEEFLDGYL